MIRTPRLHRGGDAQGLVNPAEIVVPPLRPPRRPIDAFADDIDYAILYKIYGADLPTDARYSPAQCIGCEKQEVLGNPNPKHISTSYIERQKRSLAAESGAINNHLWPFTQLHRPPMVAPDFSPQFLV